MKLTVVLLTAVILHVSASSKAQRVTLNLKNAQLSQVFKEIMTQTGYGFFYTDVLIEKTKPVTVIGRNLDVRSVLQQVLKNQSLNFSIDDKIIVIRKGQQTPLVQKPAAPIVVGRVTDKYAVPLAGVTVTVKDTRLNTATNKDGIFVISPPQESSILVFTYVGYKTLEIAANDPKVKAIVMMEDIADLDQVQVLGYSTTTKRLNTGSTTTIRAEELQKNPVPNVLQALAYRVPGLSVNQTTGVHDGGFKVRVRGINGFNAVDPLYIIDGVPYPAGGNNGNNVGLIGGLPVLGEINLSRNGTSGTGMTVGGNAMNYINMNDIESIDVLKDAASTSVYGSSGAYGVILITTKRAKGGKPRLDINLNRGIEVRGTRLDLLNTADYLAMRREALRNDGLSPTAVDVDINGTYPEDRYTNFQKELQGRAAASNRVSASYSGGANGTNYLISGTYNSYEDIQTSKGGINEGTVRMNLNSVTPDNKFSVNVSASYGSKINDMVHFDFSGDGNFTRAPNGPATILPDGSVNWEIPQNTAGLRNSMYRGLTNNLIGSTNLVFRPVKGLSLKADFGYNLLDMSELSAIPTTAFDPRTQNVNQQTNSVINTFGIRTWTVEPGAIYTTKAGAKGTLTLRAIASFTDRLQNRQEIKGVGFNSDALLRNPSSGSTQTMTELTTPQARKMGYIGLLNYNWSNKFIGDFSVRYDGSASFGPDRRFGTFAAGGLSYIFTEEKWIKEHFPVLSFGKLRASMGTAGGDGIPPFSYLGNFSSGLPYLGKTTLQPSRLSNPELGWEENKKTDIGLDLGFFKERILLQAVVYKNRTTNQLIQNPVSSVTGFTSVRANTPAILQNRGVETTLTTRNFDGRDFSWTSNIIFTTGDSKLVYFPEDLTTPDISWRVGQSVTAIRVYEYAGVDPETGLYNFINREGVKDPFTGFVFLGGKALDQVLDRTQTVELFPKYEGSISNTIRYKSVSLDFTFSLINKMGRNYLGQQGLMPGRINTNTTYHVYNKRWQNPGDVAEVAKLTTNTLTSVLGQNNFNNSTGAYERIIFSKLQNVQLAYSLSPELLKKLKLTRASVVLQGQNLLTISKYGSLDPENMSAGNLPQMRIYNLGLNVSL
ncbi:SusC/RagA family TonB-linked outer membrane protein [Pedobacter deserti]|uniref:SusC/RagA family TonB-linked outer membrane protein n=1 Tax=Pedobacter deserti TaxID=2817382 RepID=UPI00210DDC0C|nr:SusC/RagA family TonB-linked outer membrane protein [Pedobacter sp. SYSU D00382]